MTDATADNPEATAGEDPPKGSKKIVLIGLILSILLGAGGFFATFSGMFSLAAVLGGGEEAHEEEEADSPPPVSTFAFVEIGEMVVPLGPTANSDFLILETSIEVAPEDQEQIIAQMPRIRDMFNTYLRAVEARDLEAQDANLRLRAHLLRRIKVLVDPLEPRDLLFTTFILK